ncbi:MAG: hypothetical protein ACYSUC_10645, partial [Planctomycetota bacterium]
RNKAKGEIWSKEGSAHEFSGRRELEDRQSPPSRGVLSTIYYLAYIKGFGRKRGTSIAKSATKNKQELF